MKKCPSIWMIRIAEMVDSEDSGLKLSKVLSISSIPSIGAKVADNIARSTMHISRERESTKISKYLLCRNILSDGIIDAYFFANVRLFLGMYSYRRF